MGDLEQGMWLAQELEKAVENLGTAGAAEGLAAALCQ